MKYEHLFILPCCSEMLGENSTYSTVSLQDRLKKLKSEHGKVQLGNITVDMVWIYHHLISMDSSVAKLERILTYLLKIPKKMFVQVLGGMRGMIGMLWETSLLDPEEVISCSSTSRCYISRVYSLLSVHVHSMSK